MLSKKNPVLKKYKNNSVSPLTAEQLVEKILGEDGIFSHIENRWAAYKQHQQWRSRFLQEINQNPEPAFIDEDTGEKISGARALDPCPRVNQALSELVELCIDTYPEGVVKKFFELAHANPDYSRKLTDIPAISAYSEGEMEKYYARAALARIEKRYNGSVVLADEVINDIKNKAEQRVREYLSQNGVEYTMRYFEKEKMELAVPAHSHEREAAEDIKKARKLFRLDETIQPFPYTHNYEHLAYGEKHLIENPAAHGNLPKSLQAMAQKVTLPALDPEGKTPAAKKIKAQHPDIFGVEDLPQKCMTFVGSGALPLTGFVNQIITGCKVNLIDVDPEAVELSQKLRTHLEFLNVLKKDAVSVYIEHGNQVHYGGPRSDVDRVTHRGQRFTFADDKPHYTFSGESFHTRYGEDVKYIPTDILYIASLIPNHIKKSIIRNLEENTVDPVPVAVVRSARGLSSLLYEPIHQGEKDLVGSSPHYHGYGSIIPQRHACHYLNPHIGAAEGHASPASLSALLSDDNVNTAHIYYRSQLPLLDPEIVFLPGSPFDAQVKKDLAAEGREVDYSHVTEHGPAVLKHMQKELERMAKDKGITVNTEFLDGRPAASAHTQKALIEAYRDIATQYGEVKKQLSP